MRLAVVASHPIQYYAPLFRELATHVDLVVLYAHRASGSDQAKAGFDIEFNWDIELLSGYQHLFLRNIAKRPGLDHFSGCDTPDIGTQLASGRFDAVLVQGWHLKSFIQAAYATKRLGLPLLVRGDSHLETPRSISRKAIKSLAYPALLRLFDAALYVGKRSQAYWRHYHYPETRLFFSPHCVDNEWFAKHATAGSRDALRTQFGIAREAKVVLFAGKLLPFKRPLDLIVAAKQMKSLGRDIEILVAGSGLLEGELIAAAREANVRLHMMGFCNQSKMPDAYAAADIMILPSDGHETWGLVANEALACSRPIVLADTVGAAPDLAADGSVGRVFPVGDIAALVEALQDILNFPPTLQAITKKSDAYSLAAAADGIMTAIASTLLEQRGPSRARSLPMS